MKRKGFAKALRNGWCVGVKMTELIMPSGPTLHMRLVYAKLPVDRLDGF